MCKFRYKLWVISRGVELNKMIIAFEGLDRSGKSTIRRVFAKATKEKYITIDRFSTTSFVMNDWFKRKDKQQEKSLLKCENALKKSDNLVLVFLDVLPQICWKRGAEYSVAELLIQRRMFIKTLIKQVSRGIRVVVIANNKTTEKTVKELIWQIESL